MLSVLLYASKMGALQEMGRESSSSQRRPPSAREGRVA